MIASSKEKSGQLGGSHKSGQKPPKMAAQGVVATAPVLAALV